MDRTDPSTCSLDGSELVDRARAWQDVLSRALSRETYEGRVLSIYPSEPALLQRLRRLIAAEAECCSFLNFTVTEGPTETIVELTFPPEAREVVDRVVPAPNRT